MIVKNILIIEDDPFFAKGFLTRLKQVSDATLHLETSIENSLVKIDQIQPEIIFLDHHLGGENGVDSIPEIKKLSPQSEVVVVSSSNEISILKSAFKNGAVKFFPKDPLLTHNITAFLREMMEKKSGYESFWKEFLDSFKE